MTGALGALQGWDGMWRFAWSHDRAGVENPGGRMDYFNLNADPLGLASERAALCLFLRRDLPELEVEYPLVLDEADLLNPRTGAPKCELPALLWTAWHAKVGTEVKHHAESAESAEFLDLPPAERGVARSASPLMPPSERGVARSAGGSTPSGAKESHAESAESAESPHATLSTTSTQAWADLVALGAEQKARGAVRIDQKAGTFLIDTPHTSGGFAESGAHDAGALKFEILTQSHRDAEREHTDLLTPNGVRKSDTVSRVSGEQIRLSNQEDSVPPRRGVGNNSATVWASSLDGQPLASSSRILVTHLTDVQNSGVRYRDPELTILEDWGGLPHLARNGAADLSLAVADGDWMAWHLGTCFDVNVVRDGPAPWTMYFSWRPRKAIALVRSEDGFAWTQEPEICLEANPASGWEDNINRSCTVFKGGLWHLWYTGQAGGMSRIGYATSRDGVHFERVRREPVMVPEHDWEKASVMNPYVRWDEKRGLWRMWYAAGETYEPNVICYAESPDGIAWRKWERNPMFGHGPRDSWDRDRVGGFLSVDSREGTEISLGGSGWKPLMNAAMWSEAAAIAAVARRAGRTSLADEFEAKAEGVRKALMGKCWNPATGFFSTRGYDGALNPVRELHGYAPWYFGVPVDVAPDWSQLSDPRWDYFTLSRLAYRGHDVAVSWRRGRSGLTVTLDGRDVAHSPDLARLYIPLDGANNMQ